MPHMNMTHDNDPRAELLKAVGDLSEIEIFNNHVLVATYIRPDKTKSGIILTDNTRKEDEYQGKAALILKKGPMAFKDEDGQWFQDATFSEGDWIVLRPSDGWSVSVNGHPCRILSDSAVRARISRPDLVW